MGAAIDAFGARRLLSFDRDPVSRAPTVEVAHEALLREWARLREWITAAGDDVRMHRRLAAATAEWEEAARDASFVLRGDRLARVEAWAGTSELALTHAERAFLDASLAQQATERSDEASRRAREAELERRSVRRLRGLVAVFAALALVATGLTALTLDQRRRAEREARRASARELAAAAAANLGVDPELSILLALEAVDATQSADGTVVREAEEALHRAPHGVPGRVRGPAGSRPVREPRWPAIRDRRRRRRRHGSIDRLRGRDPGDRRRRAGSARHHVQPRRPAARDRRHRRGRPGLGRRDRAARRRVPGTRGSRGGSPSRRPAISSRRRASTA